jgi:ubiquinone/menaquinone biosynthesis C-methylase UbiE
LRDLGASPDNTGVRRVPEPELMADPLQARAYAEGDFAAPHQRFVEMLQAKIGAEANGGLVLDLGCGPADVTIRFARACPDACIHGIDGSEAMLALGREAVERAGLAVRVTLFDGRLPDALLPHDAYDGVLSNALLHHLEHPSVLWQTIRRAGAAGAWVFIMDLLRPRDAAHATQLVDLYASGEPEVLRRDFYNSLLAAYRPSEVRAQLRSAGLDHLESEIVSDRHFIVWGRLA